MDKNTKRETNRWVTLAIVLIGFFMILIDTTVVNVSIPTIIRDLGASISDVEWIVSGYALSFAALLITFGRLGDLYGRKLMFMLGLAVFTVASFFSGEAASTGTLIVARLFQGVGGAMLSPSVLSIISGEFRNRERALAFGAFGAVSGIGVAVGPILGGWLTTYYSWRWVFRINIPIGIIGILLAALVIRQTKDDHGKPVDILGMITSSLGFFFLVFGLIEGQVYGWLKPTTDFVLGSFTWAATQPISIIAISFILGFILLSTFVVSQIIKTKNGTSPAVDTSFFKHKTYRYGLIAIAIIALGEFSSLFSLPIFLQNVLGFSPLQSGYGLLPLAIGAFVAAPISAIFVNRFGSKVVISTGIALEATGILLLSMIHADTTYRTLIPALSLLGIGIGLAIAQNTQVILSEIDPRESGSASGVLNTIRQVGTAFGIAIIGAVLAHQTAVRIPDQIRAANLPALPDSFKEQIATAASTSSSSYSGGGSFNQLQITPPAALQNDPAALAVFDKQVAETKTNLTKAVNTGLSDSIGNAIRFGSIFMIIGVFLSLFIPNVKAKHGKKAGEPVVH